jgi:DNA damage-inducible protein 1
MKITVTTLSDEIFSLDVSEDLELENFKVFCEIESGIPSNEILINHNGKPLMENQKSLKTLGIIDGDIVILQRMFSSSNERTSSPPAPKSKSNYYIPLFFACLFVPRLNLYS